MNEFDDVEKYMSIEGLPFDSLHALAYCYNVWCAENGYPCLSMDEQDINAMPPDHSKTLTHFVFLWESLA